MQEPLDSTYDPVAILKERLGGGITQTTLADEIGVSPQYLSEILRGRKPPSDRVLDFLNLEALTVYRPKPEAVEPAKRKPRASRR